MNFLRGSFVVLLVTSFAFLLEGKTSLPNLASTGIAKNLITGARSIKLPHNWFLKVTVPSYLEDFIAQFDTFESDWDRGVSTRKCVEDIALWIAKLKTHNVTSENDKWVLQMVDAWGKIPEGILSGHVAAHGDFDQCVQVSARVDASFDGLYCSVYAADFHTAMNMTPVIPGECSASTRIVDHDEFGTQASVSVGEFFDMITGKSKPWIPLIPSIGICMPNTCSTDDVQQILVNYVNKVLNCSMYPWPATINCTDRHKHGFDAATILVIVIVACIVTLALVAGSLDYFYDNYIAGRRPNSLPYQYLMAFSFYTNSKKLLSTKKSPGDLSCIHGIRFLSTAWVVLGHTYYAFSGSPLWNIIDMQNINQNWINLAVINGTFSVDTFFTLSGFLTTFSLLKMLDKSKGKINIPMIYIHRYIRLTPVYIILVGIGATLVSYAGNGPNWYAVLAREEFCRKNWWTNILYINNFVNTEERCNGESWYLANDMQFYILAPFIVYPIWKWETMGLILLSIYSVLSCVSQVLAVRYGPAPPTMIGTRPLEESEDIFAIYFRPWTRIAPFLVGVWLGWIMHKTKGKKLSLPLPVIIVAWMACTGLALTLIFGIFPWFDVNNEIPRVSGYFYAGLSRLSWGVVISWIIFACVKGYGGFVNRFLSWTGFMPLGRLCFCIYLTSVHLQNIFHNRLTVPIKWDHYMVVHLFFAHMVMSCFAAFFCSVLFESPFIVLQKLIFEGGSKVNVGPAKKEFPNQNTLSSPNIINDDNNKQS